MSDQRARRYKRAASEAEAISGVAGCLAALFGIVGALVYASTDNGLLPSVWVPLLFTLALVSGTTSAAFAATAHHARAEAEIERLPVDQPR